ncbi:MAG: hypothetical protein ACK4HV_01825 [Parachlamydiaceae bacterium]
MSFSITYPETNGELVQDNNASIKPLGEFQGKKVFHWSFYVQATGALGGLIMAVAGLVLAIPGFIVPGLLFFTSNVIGAYYVHTFSVYSQLDSYVNDLQENLAEAKADLIRQKALNTEISDLASKTQKEIAKLQEANKKSLADWQAQEKILKDRIDALEEASSRIEKERKQALDDFNKRFSELHAEYIVLETHKKGVDAQIVSLQEKIENFKNLNSSLSKELDEFKTSYEKYDKENDELKKLNEELKIQVSELKKQIAEIPKTDTKPLEKELDETEKAAGDAVKKADIVINQLEKLLNE